MLTHPILDQLLELKLTGMHRAMTEQMNMTDLDPLSFEERLRLTRRSRDDRAGRPPAPVPAENRQAQTARLYRRHRLPSSPRPRQTPYKPTCNR